MPPRYRIICWAVPLICVQWMTSALIDPKEFECASIGFFFGTFFGHATLAAAWAALGPGPLRWRMPLSLIWVALLPVAIAINIGVHGGPDAAEVLLVIGACLFGQWLIVQAPLWTLAIGLGLRLRHIDDAAGIPDHRERQFGIRHLMIITAIVGVIFGVGRMVVSRLGDSSPMNREAPIFIFLVVAAIVLTLPLLLAGLLSRRAIPAVLAVLTLIAFATAWELTLLQVVPGGRGGGPDLGHFVSINAFTAATILAGVAVLRLNGYGAHDRRRRIE